MECLSGDRNQPLEISPCVSLEQRIDLGNLSEELLSLIIWQAYEPWYLEVATSQFHDPVLRKQILTDRCATKHNPRYRSPNPSIITFWLYGNVTFEAAPTSPAINLFFVNKVFYVLAQKVVIEKFSGTLNRITSHCPFSTGFDERWSFVVPRIDRLVLANHIWPLAWWKNLFDYLPNLEILEHFRGNESGCFHRTFWQDNDQKEYLRDA